MNRWGMLALSVSTAACRASPPAPAPAPTASLDVTPLPPSAAEAGAIASSAPSTAPAPAESGAEKRDACLRKDRSIRSADWANCSFGAFGTLRNGRGETHLYDHMGGPHDTVDTKLVGVDYGDLDGDGIEDAVVALVQHTYYASSRNTSESGQLYVYSTKGGFVELVAYEISGRPMTSVKIAKDRIVLDEATKWETCKTERVVRDTKLETARERCTKKP